MNKYTPIIGLEVHVELKTKSKMFCGCSADYFGAEPNTHTCPICLGLPGALPVPNRKAIEWCIMIALALNCKINNFSKFDRKNYFYPDLPKGYQISQYDLPFGENGRMILQSGKVIRIRRVHMEEDTGKLSHNVTISAPTLHLNKTNDEQSSSKSFTTIDFNRSGLPLVEIVTEPDFHNPEDVIEYLQKLQQIVRYLDVSNADMEKGNMRLEPNISLSTNPSVLPDYKVEVKNINSFRFVGKSIEFEIKRQTEILEKGGIPLQETRGWSEKKNETVSQRIKEEANDYRYFPEPDIPPIRFSQKDLKSLKSKIPEMPTDKITRLTHEYGLTDYSAEILSRDRAVADYFEKVARLGKLKNITPKQIANRIINQKLDLKSISATQLIANLESNSKVQVLENSELQRVVNLVINDNEKAVQDFKSGKESAIMFLVGQCMRLIGRKVDANHIKSVLLENLTT